MTPYISISVFCFFRFCKKFLICVMFFAFLRFFAFVITFEPINFWTCSAPQNDRLNFSFVKDTHIVGEKWLEMVVKQTFMVVKKTFTPVANLIHHPLCLFWQELNQTPRTIFQVSFLAQGTWPLEIRVTSWVVSYNDMISCNVYFHMIFQNRSS